MPEVSKVEESGIHWFGEYDMNPNTGKPASDFPSEYNDNSVRSLQIEVQRMSKEIEDDVYRGKDLRAFKTKFQQSKDRLTAMTKHRDELQKKLRKDPIYSKIKTAREELGEQIADAKFTSSSMMRMTDDPQIEANRMEGHCIEVKDPLIKEYCDQAGYQLTGRKISRTRAEIIWKNMGKFMGAETLDTEELRRPDNDTRGRKIFQVPA